jgi:hypothetical protein
MEDLSPKKYIQRRARLLPVDKCYVNVGWEESRMANVVITRRHVNGKLTGGIYLIDLLCLGVKDTSWFFNISEDDFLERIPDLEEKFEEVGYNLAHNIVYAGHDFALEFDIDPHKDFAVSKFILNEDNDDIPIIDIAVGDDGVPHLMTYHPNEHLDALFKLKKNAGEGNYHYTTSVKGLSEGNEDEWDDEEEDEDMIPLAEMELGTVNAENASRLTSLELTNTDLLKSRTEGEQTTLLAEALTRIVLTEVQLKSGQEHMIEKEWDYYYENSVDYSEAEEAAYQSFAESMQTIWDREKVAMEAGNETIPEFSTAAYEQDNSPLSLSFMSLLELVFSKVKGNAGGDPKKLRQSLAEKMNLQKQHDIIQLSLALRALVLGEEMGKYKGILEQPGFGNIFSNKTENFHDECLTLFYMTQVIRYSKSNQVALAIDYYYLLACQHENLFFTIGRPLFYTPYFTMLNNALGVEPSQAHMHINQE